jgi:3-Oxoacyl-[acyl-carrier-protein (ACP)] synthase III C terminal
MSRYAKLRNPSIELAMSDLGLLLERNHTVVEDWGYTGSACVPMALYDAREKGKIKDSDLMTTSSAFSRISIRGTSRRWETAAYTNVKAQLNVGRGSTAARYDYDFSDWSVYNTGGGDADGVGHFRAKNNTEVIQRNMITTPCVGTGLLFGLWLVLSVIHASDSCP